MQAKTKTVMIIENITLIGLDETQKWDDGPQMGLHYVNPIQSTRVGNMPSYHNLTICP